jgi:hypothetical protein
LKKARDKTLDKLLQALLQALLYRIQMHWMQLHAAQMPPFQSPYDCSYLLL